MADAERQPDPKPAETPAPPSGEQAAAANPYRVPDGGWPAVAPQPGQAPAWNGQAWSPQAWAPQQGQPYAYGYPYPPAAYGYYGQQPYAQRPSTEPKLPLAFISLLVAYLVVPIAPALLALKLAADARKRILASRGTLTGLGLVSAVRWLSVLHIVMVVGGSSLFGVLLLPVGLLL